VAANPLYRDNGDPDAPGPLLELKTRLVLYLAQPPGPVTSRRIYDLYMARFEADIAGYRSTAYGSEANNWTPAARSRFEAVELPNLRRRRDWGYLFGSDKASSARLFLFHGSRPAAEAGRASLLRFDFEWDFDLAILRQFTMEVLAGIECVCGTAGYVLCPDEGDYARTAHDLMFAWAMRYWGAEAQDLDASLDYALTGFPCVSWLTIIGPGLAEQNRDALAQAKAVSHSWFESGDHTIIQAEERPRPIDRNRREPLGNFPAVASALLPFQAKAPVPLVGDLWDEDNTKRYLRRFTHPDQI
jgi:hypothetical protein